MKSFKKINIMLFVAFFTQNVFASTFTVENETGISPYREYLSKKGIMAEEFRIRVTFHESAKDIYWLNKHYQEVNKAYVPMLNGSTSKPVNIKFPEFESDSTKFITLYLTATCYDKEKTDHFLKAATFELKEPQSIKNIHIRFQSISLITDPYNIEINVKNSLEIKAKFTQKSSLSYGFFE